MAQTREIVTSVRIAQDHIVLTENVAQALSTSFANVLVLKQLKGIRQTNIIFKNTDGAISENYKVFVSNDPDSTDVVTGDSWHEKIASTAVGAGSTSDIEITGTYSKIIVQANSVSGTPSCSLWAKSRN